MDLLAYTWTQEFLLRQLIFAIPLILDKGNICVQHGGKMCKTLTPVSGHIQVSTAR